MHRTASSVVSASAGAGVRASVTSRQRTSNCGAFVEGSGHHKAQRLAILVGFSLFFGVQLGANRVTAAPRVVCIDLHDSELATRIQGQTRDLRLSLAWVQEPLNGEATAPQLASVARRRSADFVVVVQPDNAGGLNVFVYATAQDVLRTRGVPKPRDADRMGASTMAETAALIVRGELSAALASQNEASAAHAANAPSTTSIAPPTQQRQPPPSASPASTSKPAPLKAAPTQPIAARAPASSDETPGDAGRLNDATAWSLAAAVRVSAPGAGLWLKGAWLGLQLTRPSFVIGVSAGTTLAEGLARDDVHVSLRRHSLSAEGFGRLALNDRLALLVGGSAGVVLYTRVTDSTGSVLMKTADKGAFSLQLGPLAELRWHVAHSVGLAARVGVDFLLQPTLFAYENVARQRTTLGKLAVYEPWVALALFVDIAK